MPEFSTYPFTTSLSPTDSFLINQASSSSVKQIEVQDLQASLTLPSLGGILPLNKGGTGAALANPGQDSIVFWDQSAAAIKFLTIGDGLQIVGTTISTTTPSSPGGGGAPTDATYITQLPNSELTNEFALSALGTGLLKNATGTGVLTIAVAGTDYAIGPGSSTGNAIARFNGSGGGTFKDSNVTLADSGTAFVFTGGAGITAGGSNQNVVITPSGTGWTLLASAIQTAAPATGTAGKWKIGQVVTGAVTLDTTSYVLVEINGALIKLLKAA